MGAFQAYCLYRLIACIFSHLPPILNGGKGESLAVSLLLLNPPPSLVHLVWLCSALSLLRGSHFLFLKEELWQLTQRGAPLLYGVCSLSLVPVPLARPSNGMISSCMASSPQPSFRKSSSQRSVRSMV